MIGYISFPSVEEANAFSASILLRLNITDTSKWADFIEHHDRNTWYVPINDSCWEILESSEKEKVTSLPVELWDRVYIPPAPIILDPERAKKFSLRKLSTLQESIYSLYMINRTMQTINNRLLELKDGASISEEPLAEYMIIKICCFLEAWRKLENELHKINRDDISKKLKTLKNQVTKWNQLREIRNELFAHGNLDRQGFLTDPRLIWMKEIPTTISELALINDVCYIMLNTIIRNFSISFIDAYHYMRTKYSTPIPRGITSNSQIINVINGITKDDDFIEYKIDYINSITEIPMLIFPMYDEKMIDKNVLIHLNGQNIMFQEVI